jgi:spore maturation protein CgeB
MRFCQVTTYPADVLRRHYRATPHLAREPYDTQHRAMLDLMHGWSDFIARRAVAAGHQARVIIANDTRGQARWATEHGMSPDASRDTVLIRQVADFHPDAVFLEDSFSFSRDLVRALREQGGVRALVGWLGILGRTPEVLKDVDLLVTCAAPLSETFRAQGMRVATMLHAFEPAVLSWVTPRAERLPVSFVGSLSATAHRGRLELLERVNEAVPLSIYSDTLRPGWRAAARDVVSALVRRNLGHQLRLMRSGLRRGAHPGIHGLDMFAVLQASDVSLNSHGDAVPVAANMRLFESTGCGSCMLTDWKPNLADLFEPDREAVTFRSAGECAEKARWLLEHPGERRAIAAAGQRRTLKDHTFDNRVPGLLADIERVLQARD